MSSPFGRKTKKGTEETLEALSRTREWASRIDTKNDATNLSLDFIDELREEEERLRERYRVKTTEVAIDNFVSNREETVCNILCGDIDTKVSALSQLEDFIADCFGAECPLDLSKEELIWLISEEVKHHQNNRYGVDVYSEEPFISENLDNKGEQPNQWNGDFPIYNR